MEADFEPPGLAKIFFSDIQSITLNYHTPRRMQILFIRWDFRQSSKILWMYYGEVTKASPRHAYTCVFA